MADAKKKSVKKVESKKVTKSNRKEPDLVIPVPQGGQTICSFLLTPSLPKDGKATDWKVVEVGGSKKDLDSIKVSFSPDSTEVQRYFERAVLVVKMSPSTDNKDGIWRFASDGVVVNSNTPHSDFAVEVTDQGRTLIAYVHDIDSSTEEVLFSYLASYTDKKSGQVTVYQSQDPGVGVGRP